MTRLLPFLYLFLSGSIWATEIPWAINVQKSYQENGINQSGEHKVILVLVSQPECNYCVLITEEILKPMILSGRYTHTTLFRKLEINTQNTLKDFNGQQVSHDLFAQRYNTWTTPTLLFLNRNGEEIVKKMVGINTLDLYAYYVDKSLSDAFKKINPN